MSLTAGVPRIKEIINASKEISTPVINCRLERRSDLSIPEGLARVVKGRIESLYLEDVTSYIQIQHSLDRPSCLYIRISLDTIDELGLDITVHDVCLAIQRHRRFKGAKLRIQVRGKDEIKLSTESALKSGKRSQTAKSEESSTTERLLRLQLLRRFLPTIQISGHQLATRAVVMAEDDPMSDKIKAKRAVVEEKSATKSVVETRPEIKQEADETAGPSTKKVPPKGKSRKAAISTKGTENEAADETPIKIEDDAVAAVPVAPAPADSKPLQMHKLLVSGYGLRYCLSTRESPPIKPRQTPSSKPSTCWALKQHAVLSSRRSKS